MSADDTNLLAETLLVMGRAQRTSAEVIFIGSQSGYSCTWNEYTVLADVIYDSGYGGANVAEDLRIVFADGAFMERSEYDGAEWWTYHAPALNLPAERKPIRTLVRGDDGLGENLADFHKATS